MQNKQPWLKLPIELLQKDDLSLSTKIIYAYMLWRYSFFKKAHGGVYFESQDTIGTSCGVSRKTTNEAVQRLSAIGWVASKKNSHSTSTYVVKDVFGLYEGSSKNSCSDVIDYDEDVF